MFIFSSKEIHYQQCKSSATSKRSQIFPLIVHLSVSLQFRSLRVPTTERLRELLQYLHEKGDDACYEFYRALHIQAEDVYFSLPTRIRQRGKALSLSENPSQSCGFIKSDTAFFIRYKLEQKCCSRLWLWHQFSDKAKCPVRHGDVFRHIILWLLKTDCLNRNASLL